MASSATHAQSAQSNMIVLLLAFAGGIAGSVLLGGPGGFWAGAAVGALAGWVSRLDKRLKLLEQRLDNAAEEPLSTAASTDRGAARATPAREPMGAASAPEPAGAASGWEPMHAASAREPLG